MTGDTLYKLKEGKGHLIEYDVNGKLIYEGDNINGKGKYYYNGTLKYEGEYLNGEKNGKGKEYQTNGNILFEGIYLHDLKRTGK